ncbi:MAG: hypothetical protein KatS3mg073_0142 [Meiothermus sp.]|nr:MAG: hypothetical protein KatS3mg073_0142 [Meiothermus sp.]
MWPRAGLEAHQTIVPEGEDTLAFAEAAGDYLVLGYLHHASQRLEMVDLEGQSRGRLPLPTLGMVPTIAGEERRPGGLLRLYLVPIPHHPVPPPPCHRTDPRPSLPRP